MRWASLYVGRGGGIYIDDGLDDESNGPSGQTDFYRALHNGDPVLIGEV